MSKPLVAAGHSQKPLAKRIESRTTIDGSSAVASSPVTGTGVRMLIYSHDTFGLGHLRRCLKISQALASRYSELAILLVTGSPLVHRYELPPQVDYIKLPAVRKTGQEHYEARSLATSFARILNLRTRLLLEAVREYRPHVVLVDHSPTGMKGEMLPALEWLKQQLPESTVILGLRDIIDDPSLVIPHWESQNIYDVLERLYTNILVYGSPDVFDPVDAYHFSPALKRKTHFCHYFLEEYGGVSQNRRKRRARRGVPLVVVTIGGGDGAVETVIDPYVAMLSAHRDEIDFDSVILTGPFVSADHLRLLQKNTKGLPVIIKRFVPQTRSLLEQSELVIATAGYNTTTEILNYGRRALLIPRMLHRKEQFLRASQLERLGLVTMLHPADVTVEVLYTSVINMMESPHEPLVAARADHRIPFDGCDRLVEWLRGVVIKHTSQYGDLA